MTRQPHWTESITTADTIVRLENEKLKAEIASLPKASNTDWYEAEIERLKGEMDSYCAATHKAAKLYHGQLERNDLLNKRTLILSRGYDVLEIDLGKVRAAIGEEHYNKIVDA